VHLANLGSLRTQPLVTVSRWTKTREIFFPCSNEEKEQQSTSKKPSRGYSCADVWYLSGWNDVRRIEDTGSGLGSESEEAEKLRLEVVDEKKNEATECVCATDKMMKKKKKKKERAMRYGLRCDRLRKARCSSRRIPDR